MTGTIEKERRILDILSDLEVHTSSEFMESLGCDCRALRTPLKHLTQERYITMVKDYDNRAYGKDKARKWRII